MTEKNLETTDIKPRKFFVTDIHGGYRSFLQVLKLSNFNKEIDTLICGGDVVDGWPETVQLIDELLTIKNLITIEGNHDSWCHEWLKFGVDPWIWTTQGGTATIASYMGAPEKMPIHLTEYFNKMNLYYVDSDNNAFVHGGYKSKEGLGHNHKVDYTWDRTLWEKAKSAKKEVLNMSKMYNKVFIGHTSLGWPTLPQKKGNIWNLDTGGGWEGALTLMNIDTEEYFMSDRVMDLYPEVKAMRGFKLEK